MVMFRVWKLVVVGLVVALLSTQVRADEPTKTKTKPKSALQKKIEVEVEVALALAATKRDVKGFVNLAPVPRVVPEPMPAKKPEPKKDVTPNDPAPVGWEWRRYPGQPWKLYQLEASQTATGKSQGSTQTTPARGVVQPSTPLNGSFPTVSTYTLAPGVKTRGGTNCSPLG